MMHLADLRHILDREPDSDRNYFADLLVHRWVGSGAGRASVIYVLAEPFRCEYSATIDIGHMDGMTFRSQ